MSKISRNVKSFPTELLQTIKRNTKGSNKLNDYFGDEVQGHSEMSTSEDFPLKPLSTISSGSDFDSALYLDIDKLSGLSSTSSTSWSEEYESDATKKTFFEMEKLDSIFQGIDDSDSLGNFQDEVDEWKEIFGNISILGRVTPSNSTESSDVELENDHSIVQLSTRTKHPSIHEINVKKQNIFVNKDCDILNYNSKIRIQLPDSDHVPGELKIPRTGTGRVKRRLEDPKTKNKTNKSVFTFSNKPRSLDIEKYLKISSLKSPKLNERKMSSKSLIIHQKIPCDVVPVAEEFNSLPFLPDFTRRCNLSTKSIRKKSIQHEHKKTSDNHHVILPPINLNYRSVSATPRASSKVLSALSVKFSNLQSRLGSRIIDHLDDVPLSNR